MPHVVDNSIIHLHFQLHANPANIYETRFFERKNGLSINTINLIGSGERKMVKTYFFHRLHI